MMKRIILLVCIAFILYFYKSHTTSADAYSDGLIIVKHAKLHVKRVGHFIQFNHPCKLEENTIANILSSIYYKEKGLLKRKGTFKVFQDGEIEKLTPLIVKAFSIATPDKVVSTTSYSERVILTDKKNNCIMFITDHTLNIVFNRIHSFQTYNDIMSAKKKYLVTKENPAKKTHSHFWQLLPTKEQQLEPGHENWLIINLSK